MDGKQASMLLVFLALLGWVLSVVILAEPKGVFTFSGGGGAGVFETKGGGKTAFGCDGRQSTLEAVRAFGVIGCLIMGVLMLIHVAQAAGKGDLVPAAITPYVRFCHIGAAFCMMLTWVLLVCLYAAKFSCHNSISDWVDTSPGHAMFLGIVAMITEIVCFFLCSSGGAQQSSGAQPFI